MIVLAAGFLVCQGERLPVPGQDGVSFYEGIDIHTQEFGDPVGFILSEPDVPVLAAAGTASLAFEIR